MVQSVTNNPTIPIAVDVGREPRFIPRINRPLNLPSIEQIGEIFRITMITVMMYGWAPIITFIYSWQLVTTVKIEGIGRTALGFGISAAISAATIAVLKKRDGIRPEHFLILKNVLVYPVVIGAGAATGHVVGAVGAAALGAAAIGAIKLRKIPVEQIILRNPKAAVSAALAIVGAVGGATESSVTTLGIGFGGMLGAAPEATTVLIQGTAVAAAAAIIGSVGSVGAATLGAASTYIFFGINALISREGLTGVSGRDRQDIIGRF